MKIIKSSIFCCLLMLSTTVFTQEYSVFTTSSYANTKTFGFPSLENTPKHNASLDYFNATLLQDSSSEGKRSKKGRTIRNIGMGFTITSIVTGLTGLGVGLSSMIPLSKGDVGTGVTLANTGSIIGGVAAALFVPGVIMWPVGASMIKKAQ